MANVVHLKNKCNKKFYLAAALGECAVEVYGGVDCRLSEARNDIKAKGPPTQYPEFSKPTEIK